MGRKKRLGKLNPKAKAVKKSISTRSIKGIRMTKGNPDGDSIEQYVHGDKTRAYNPPVGLVTPETDKEMPKTKYSYDPHLDPQLHWTGKAEQMSFDVDTVSLHVHERIDPITIIEKMIKKEDEPVQMSLFHYFEKPEQNPPLREAIHFYKHSQNWSNRLIAGDSLLVMNSLLQKEGIAGKVQMIYIDPPYGVRYGSNFQPFINKRDVKDGTDEDLTQEPEMVKAFRDTWELGIHSYLTYLRDRLLLAKELLAETGSCFVQISDENIHHVKELLDEVFRKENFVALIPFVKTTSSTTNLLSKVNDYLVWFAKDIKKIKYRQLYIQKEIGGSGGKQFNRVELKDGTVVSSQVYESDNLSDGKYFYIDNLQSASPGSKYWVEVQGKKFFPKNYWKTDEKGMENLKRAGRIVLTGNNIGYKRYFDDFPVFGLNNFWDDTTASFQTRIYVVQTIPKVIERCLLMTTDPGDLVLDPTCGSGTTAFVAEQWGRRWITCDTSRVSVALAKQRLMTATFDYYELAHPDEGISSGLNYQEVSHITLGSVANNEVPQKEVLVDRPFIDKNRKRITGPFTIEAVPSPRVTTIEEAANVSSEPDTSISRSGESVRMNDWIDELRITGIRGKSGQKIEFARIEPLGATRYLQAEGETREKDPKRVAISFGPAYAPLEQKQVELAIEEAQKLVPKPKIIVFASFQFDPEAAKDIDETDWPGITILKVQMNTDLLTADLKKKRSSNESFWLIGQPDINMKKSSEKYILEVNGFDYYNPKTGEIESGDISKIAMWLLDTNYDGRSLYPRQVFFPMAGPNEGWEKLAKNLKGIVNEELIENFRGSKSLPFKLGDKKRVAIKIIDDRGIESLKLIEVKE